MYKTVKYNIMGMRNENRGMDNKAVMTGMSNDVS